MSSNNPPKSLKELRDRTSQLSFVGREAQLQQFRSVIATPCNERDRFIFNISGQGGIGKTTLLEQLQHVAKELGHVTAYVDEGSTTNPIDDLPEALNWLVLNLAKQNHKCKRFQKQYKVYKQRKQELESDPEAPKGLVASIGKVIAKAGLGAVAANVPGSGAVLDIIDPGAVSEKAGEWAAYTAQKLANNKDELQLVTEPLKVLTPLLIEDLNQIAKEKTLVLLLDTYEKIGMFFDDWLLSVLEGRYLKELSPNYLFCIAGREPLPKNAWIEWESLIVRSELEPFTEAESRLYLASKGIHNELVVQEILRLSSNGLPVLIAMMAQNAPTNVTQVGDYCEEAVERFLKWETDSKKRKLLENASIPRILNRDVLAVLTNEEEADELFNWLKKRSFVVKRPGGGWQYHGIVGQQMMRYRQKISPQGFFDTHKKIESYYERLSKELDLTETQSLKDKTWQRYELEKLYHTLCLAPQKSLSMVLSKLVLFVKVDSNNFSQDWAKVIEEAGKATNCISLEDWGRQFYIALNQFERNETKLMTNTLLKLLQEVQLGDEVRAVAAILGELVPLLGFLNEISFDLGQAEIEPALDKIDEAINRGLISQTIIESLSEYLRLYPRDSEYLLLRACLRLFLGHLETSLEDIERVDSMNSAHNQQKEELNASDFKLIIEKIKSPQSGIDTSSERIAFPALLRKYCSDQNLEIQKLQLEIEALEFKRQERISRIQANTDAMRSRISLIREKFRDKKYKEMKKLIRELYEIDEDKYWAFRAVGEVQLASRKYNAALELLNAAVRLCDKDSRCYYARFLVYKALGEPNKANDDITNAVNLAKAEYKQEATRCDTLNLALYQLVSGNIDQSVTLYQSVLSSSENSQIAIQDLQDLLQLFPNDVQAQKMIAFFREQHNL